MISKVIDDNSVSVIPEDSDDLLTLRRIVKKGDRIIGDTTRVIKQEKDFSRHDRGERIKIRISIEVEKPSLDNMLDRLRLRGIIVESTNESVPHGSHHSFVVKINDAITIFKKKWSLIEKKLIRSKNQKFGFLLVAIDTGECGIGKLKGTHLQILPNIYSGSSGKRYKINFNIEKFFECVLKAVLSSVNENDSLIIFGPGETKKKFTNFLQKNPLIKKHQVQVVEGIDSGGEDGIYMFTKSRIMKEIMSESKLATVSSMVDEIMLRVNKKSRKFTMGFDETQKANQFGAIDSLIFSEKIIQTLDEEKVIKFLNDVEEKGSKVFSVDSTTDLGLRVTGLGGIVSLLRFAISN